jgi:hypothetical protein
MEDRKTDRTTNGQYMNRETERLTDRQTEKQADREKGTKADWYKEGQTYRQLDR